MNWIYSDKVKEHFQQPKNILENEDAYQADGIGEIGNPVCGDMMLMMIKVDKEENVITDCKWKTYGCASAIASTSMLSEMVKGKKLEEAYNIKPQDIIQALHGLPNNKIHCSVLGDKALRKAIDDYYKKNNINHEDYEPENKIVCTCLNVSENDIKEQVMNNHVDTFEALQEHTKISTSCGQCENEARALLEEYLLLKEEEKHE
ncbi:MAG: iron-sulfur cluster assembly scaffold protein [Bacteroidota bacterium]